MRDSTDTSCFPRDLMRANSRFCRRVTPTSKGLGGSMGAVYADGVGHAWLSGRGIDSGMLGALLPRALCHSPRLFRPGLGTQRVLSPPAALWPGRQPLPVQVPCSLMSLRQRCPSPSVIPPSWARGTTISAQNYSPPARLLSSPRHCK